MIKDNTHYYEVPPELHEYQYLNLVVNDKMDKDDDYFAVSEQLWEALKDLYDISVDIVRPVKKTKKSYFYDAELLACDIIMVNFDEFDTFL